MEKNSTWTNKYMYFTTVQPEDEDWDPVKLAYDPLPLHPPK